MRRGAEFMGERAADLKKLADAAQPLYEKLDDGQKRRFAMLLRTGMRPGMQNRFARWRDRAEMRGDDYRDGWRHHGPGMSPRFGQRENDGPGGPGPRRLRLNPSAARPRHGAPFGAVTTTARVARAWVARP